MPAPLTHRINPAFVWVLLFVGATAMLLALFAVKVFSVGSDAPFRAVDTAAEFNQGNAAYEGKQYGKAIWHYERARLSSPRDADVLKNLALAQKSAGISSDETLPFSKRLGDFLSSEGWVLVACIGLWAAIAILLIMSAMRWRGAIPAGLLILCIFIFGVGAIGAIGAIEAQQAGIVVAKETPLCVAPTSQSPKNGLLSEGQSAKILERRGDYLRVETSGGATGWVSMKDFIPLF